MTPLSSRRTLALASTTLALAAALGLPAPGRAQDAATAAEGEGGHPALQQGRRAMTALRIGDADELTLDGRLEEPFWERVEPATDFIMQDPVLGGAPTERTEYEPSSCECATTWPS